MTDSTAASAGAPPRRDWILAIELAIGCAIYGSAAGFVFNRLLHWIDVDVSRTAFWSLLLFIVASVAIRMARAGDASTMSDDELRRLRRAATVRATNWAVIGVTLILTLWAYGVHRQWL